MAKWTDFYRLTGSGLGVEGVSVAFKLHSDDTTIATESTDADGLVEFEASGHPGPFYHVGTTSGQTKRRSTKAMGTIFLAEVPYALLALGDGVIPDVDDELEVFGDSSGMQVKVRTGVALEFGHIYRGIAQQTIPISANASGNARIDRVIARLTMPGEAEEGKFEITVLEGTPGADPTAPDLTNDATVREQSLARVAVANGAATITSGNVTDERTFLPDYDSLQAQLDLKAPLASPTFTGTMSATGNVAIGDSSVDKHVLAGQLDTTGTGPSLAVGTNAGSGTGDSVVKDWGSDTSGHFTLVAGSTAANGSFLTMTWQAARISTNYSIILFPANTDAAELVLYHDFDSNTVNAGFIRCKSGITPGDTYEFNYLVIG